MSGVGQMRNHLLQGLSLTTQLALSKLSFDRYVPKLGRHWLRQLYAANVSRRQWLLLLASAGHASNHAFMTTLLIDMPSGVAGDMLLAALLACGGNRERLEQDLLGLGCGPIRIRATSVMAGSLSATLVEVEADQEPTWMINTPVSLHAARRADVAASDILSPVTPVAAAHEHHEHRPYARIRDLLARASLPPRVIQRAQQIFRLLAEAEASVHGTDPETVEFHEVGSLDAIADIVGACLLLEQLGIDTVISGPILPGHGTVTCAHGRMPVPVPAVAEILRRTKAPTVLLGRDTGELTTPTGCAIICALAERFIDAAGLIGTYRIRNSGFGAGHKTIPGLVNAVRCSVLESVNDNTPSDQVVEISATIDDMTGEDLALATEDILAQGALDVWLMPVIMKKGRPGHILTALVRPDDQGRLTKLFLTRTSTIGVRHRMWDRAILPRREVTAVVQGQPIRMKVVTLPDGSERAKPEADDVALAARTLGLAPTDVREQARQAHDQ